ncbi:unnamed protein product, partial [Urochloa humidicola]
RPSPVARLAAKTPTEAFASLSPAVSFRPWTSVEAGGVMGVSGGRAAAGLAARAARAVTEESEHTAGRDGTGADVPSRPRAHYSVCHPLAPLSCLTAGRGSRSPPAGAAPPPRPS